MQMGGQVRAITHLLNAVAQKLAERMVLAFDLNNGAEGVEYGGYDRHWAGIQRDKGDIKPSLNTNIPSFYQPRDAQVTWMQFVTAYGALIDIGKLQKGDDRVPGSGVTHHGSGH